MAEIQSSTLADKFFSCNVGPFKYSFEYLEQADVFTISCEHINEFYSWTALINETFKSPPDAKVGYNLSPKHLCKILFEYKKGVSNPYLKVEIQDKYESSVYPMYIKITIYATYDISLFDSKTLILNPLCISSEERMVKKLQQRDNQISELTDKIEQLQSDVEALKKVTDGLRVCVQNIAESDRARFEAK